MTFNKGQRVSISVSNNKVLYGTVITGGEYLVDVLFDGADYVDLNINTKQLEKKV